MNKQILAIAAVLGVLFIVGLIRATGSGSNGELRYDANIPYVPPYPGSTIVRSSADPGVPFGVAAARIVVTIPDGSGYALWFQTDAYDEYVALLEQHGWQRLKRGETLIAQTYCHSKTFTHSDTVWGPGSTLSVSEESMAGGGYWVEAVVTRGYRTGPQSCSDM